MYMYTIVQYVLYSVESVLRKISFKGFALTTIATVINPSYVYGKRVGAESTLKSCPGEIENGFKRAEYVYPKLTDNPFFH